MTADARIPSKQLGTSIDVIDFATPSGTPVGALVRYDPNNNLKVLAVPDNDQITPVIGRVLSKPSGTVARVLMQGKIVGLSIGIGKMFLSTSGGFQIGVPTTGIYIQTLGFSFGDGSGYLKPGVLRIKRS